MNVFIVFTDVRKFAENIQGRNFTISKDVFLEKGITRKIFPEDMVHIILTELQEECKGTLVTIQVQTINNFMDDVNYQINDDLSDTFISYVFAQVVDPPLEVTIHENDGVYDLYEQSGAVVEHGFDTEDEAEAYAKNNNMKVVDSFFPDPIVE